MEEELKKLLPGQRIFIPLGEESGIAVWLIEDLYFCFEITQFGGSPVYINHFENIKEVQNAILNLT